METISKLRKWGNSFGVLVPKELVKKENFRLNEEVVVKLEKKNDLMQLFGLCKFKKSTKQLMKDIREGYDE